MDITQFKPVDTDLVAILPILVAALGGILGLIIEMVNPKRNNNLIVGATLISLALAIGTVVMQFESVQGVKFSFGGLIQIDRFALVAQSLVLLSAFLSGVFSEAYLRAKRIPFGEFYPILMWCVVGGLMLCTTSNLLMLFLGVEVLSIALYVMAGMSRAEQKSNESALKYFLLGSFASGFLLYGMALLYGSSGSLNMSDMAPAWEAGTAATKGLMLLGTGMLLIGLGFKAGFVPFHQWTPDVYQGAPTNVSAFMAAGSKIGAFAALWRVLDGLTMFKEVWIPALGVIAILTMTVGNLLALVQKDVKRVLGYSSISHAGYVLVGIIAHFAAPDKVGFNTVAYYLLAYTMMTVGAFAVVSLTTSDKGEVTTMDHLRGLRTRAPFAAGALIVFMFSLTGVPPFSGFFGKMMIFNDAVTAGLQPLALVLAVNSIISAYYYLGIAKAAFVDESTELAPVPSKGLLASVGTASGLCLAGVILGTILFSPILDFFGGKPPKRPNIVIPVTQTVESAPVGTVQG